MDDCQFSRAPSRSHMDACDRLTAAKHLISKMKKHHNCIKGHVEDLAGVPVGILVSELICKSLHQRAMENELTHLNILIPVIRYLNIPIYE